MKHESVAILDIRSGEINFLLGSKGVNGMFTLGGMHSEKYEGYVKEGFFDLQSFKDAVLRSASTVLRNYNGTVAQLFVGVPSAFVSLRTIGNTITFQGKRKLTEQDVDELFNTAQAQLMQTGVCIRRSQMYFELGDNCRYFAEKDIYGVSTNLLKGALCFYFAEEEFCETVKSILAEFKFEQIHFLPSTLAQATYLIPEKKREGYAFLLDLGFLTSSISVLYGNGVVHEETFNCGVATVVVALMNALNVDYMVAEEILASADICGGNVPKDALWTTENGDNQFPVAQINDVIKCELDVLCEGVDFFFASKYGAKAATGFTVNPIGITGEGVDYIRGASEHISNRLNRRTEILKPEQPFRDKPENSSRLGLLALATEKTERKESFLQRLFKSFGGNK